jgi:PqqD family protein of HPr-rel-A system
VSDAPAESTETAAARWQSTDPALLDWASWDDGQALYHLPSGKTHFVNTDTVRLLEILRVPRHLDEIVTNLWGDVPPQDFEEVRGEAFGLLLRLAELGLVHAQ